MEHLDLEKYRRYLKDYQALRDLFDSPHKDVDYAKIMSQTGTIPREALKLIHTQDKYRNVFDEKTIYELSKENITTQELVESGPLNPSRIKISRRKPSIKVKDIIIKDRALLSEFFKQIEKAIVINNAKNTNVSNHLGKTEVKQQEWLCQKCGEKIKDIESFDDIKKHIKQLSENKFNTHACGHVNFLTYKDEVVEFKSLPLANLELDMI